MNIKNENLDKVENFMKTWDEENKLKNSFMIVYKKDSVIQHNLSFLMKSPNSDIPDRILNRELIVDTIGEYEIVYDVNLSIEDVLNLLTTQVMGYSITELNKLRSEIETRQMN